MRTIRITAVSLIVTIGLARSVHAQTPDIQRTVLTRQDLGDSIREVIQVRVDFAARAAFPMHSHPGVEVAYVLEGSLEYQLEGREPIRLEAGDSLFIPAGTIHSVKNLGAANGSELATYVVDKATALVVVAP